MRETPITSANAAPPAMTATQGSAETLKVAFAAERVIVVVEELVDESVIRADPNRTVIPGLIVDAVVVEEDDMARWGVQQAIEEAGLSGKVAVAGAGLTASILGLSDVVHGTQSVEVWGNPERTAHAAAQAAIELCHDPDITKVAGSASVTWPGRDPMRAILLAPVAITKDNISIVINADMYWRQSICPAGPSFGPLVPPACHLGPVPIASASAQSQP